MNEVITAQLVRLNIACNNKKNLIGLMADDLDKAGRLLDKRRFVESVMEREKLFSTEVEFGFAIPHGKTDAVTEPSIAVARLREEMVWSQNKIRFVVLLAIPERAGADTHLKIIAAFSRKLMDEDFRSMLLTAETEEEIANAINESIDD